MQLSDVYSSLFCTAACSEKTFSPPVVARALVEKQTERDAAILRLSILRRLFESKLLEDVTIESRPSSAHTDSLQQLAAKRDLREILLNSHKFVDNLICQLQCTDQFISFCASKALVAVFLSCVVQVEWLSALLSQRDTKWFHSHVAIYSWQVLTELLKALRKQLLTSMQQESDSVLCKRNTCFTVLLPTWSEILKLYTATMTARGQEVCDQHMHPHTRLELSLGEFLSLTVEMLRHKCYSNHSPPLEQQMDSPIPHCQTAIVHSLFPIASILEYSNSVTLLKRVLDILLKVTGSPMLSSDAVEQLLPHLANILKVPTIKGVLHSWMSTVGGGLIQTAVGATASLQLEIVERTGSVTVRDQDSSFDTGLLKTVVRRLILFLLKYATAVLEREAQSEGSAALFSAHLDWVLREVQVLASSAGWSVPSNGVPQVAREVVFQVLSEQDDCVVEALLACCQIHMQYNCCGRNSDSPSLTTCVNIFNPHSLFVEFLRSIAYDHTVLVDFLISSESKFQDLFHEYLQIATNDWKQLKLACLQYDDARLTISSTTYTENTSDSHSTAPEKPVCPYLDTVCSRGCGVQRDKELGGVQLETQEVKKRKLANGGRSSTDNSTALSTNNSSCDCNSKHHSSPGRTSFYCETTLDRALDCFTRLKFTLVRLGGKNLLPGIPTEDIVPLLESLESLYEQEASM